MKVLKQHKWYEVFPCFFWHKWTVWSFQSSFHKSNLKSWWPKKYKFKGPNIYNPNQFMAFQNLLCIFFKWISNVIFSPRSSYLRLISKSPKYYEKSRLQWVPLYKILNWKIIIIHFQNPIFDTKTRLQH